MPISLNPVHYVLLASIIFNVGMLGYSQVIKTRLSLTADQFRAFKAKVSSEAEEQKLKNLREARERDEITLKLEERNEKLKKDLDTRYAEYKRLLNSATRPGDMPTLSRIAESAACGQDKADSVGTMDDIEARLLEILKQGDTAINAAITYEDWGDEQKMLKDNEK